MRQPRPPFIAARPRRYAGRSAATRRVLSDKGASSQPAVSHRTEGKQRYAGRTRTSYAGRRTRRRGAFWTESEPTRGTRSRTLGVARSDVSLIRARPWAASDGSDRATSSDSQQVSHFRVLTSKIRNFRIRAPFLTFFISTRR